MAGWTWYLISGLWKAGEKAESSCPEGSLGLCPFRKSRAPGLLGSQSQLFGLSQVLLENKIPLDSEKKYVSFKDSKEDIGWGGLREGQIAGGEVREVKWGGLSHGAQS